MDIFKNLGCNSPKFTSLDNCKWEGKCVTPASTVTRVSLRMSSSFENFLIPNLYLKLILL